MQAQLFVNADQHRIDAEGRERQARVDREYLRRKLQELPGFEVGPDESNNGRADESSPILIFHDGDLIAELRSQLDLAARTNAEMAIPTPLGIQRLSDVSKSLGMPPQHSDEYLRSTNKPKLARV